MHSPKPHRRRIAGKSDLLITRQKVMKFQLKFNSIKAKNRSCITRVDLLDNWCPYLWMQGTAQLVQSSVP